MTLQRGPNDPAIIAGYSKAELIAEARRIAHNTRIMGGEYTARLMEAMAEQLEKQG